MVQAKCSNRKYEKESQGIERLWIATSLCIAALVLDLHFVFMATHGEKMIH
jgi:hypothetical protein